MRRVGDDRGAGDRPREEERVGVGFDLPRGLFRGVDCRPLDPLRPLGDFANFAADFTDDFFGVEGIV